MRAAYQVTPAGASAEANAAEIGDAFYSHATLETDADAPWIHCSPDDPDGVVSSPDALNASA
jgi:hypothetical protein